MLVGSILSPTHLWAPLEAWLSAARAKMARASELDRLDLNPGIFFPEHI